MKKTDLNAFMTYLSSMQRPFPLDTYSDLSPTPLSNPITAKIAKSALVLNLKHLATAPQTDSKPPLARINATRVLPGKSERLFIQDLRGFLYEYVGDQWVIAIDLIREKPQFIHNPGLATGFGSFAFHPDFQENNLLFTTHTEPAGEVVADFRFEDSVKVALKWVLTEWKIDDPESLPFQTSSRTLLRVDMAAAIHGVQDCTFNPLAEKGDPDYGMLYLGIGDGGSAGEGHHYITSGIDRIWGSVIRILPTGRNSRNGAYGVPTDNPYTNIPQACQEIYCRGFRNPNRIAWSANGKMWITDIGQSNSEEINLGVAGGDYGWPEREGTFLIRSRGNLDQAYSLPVEGDSRP